MPISIRQEIWTVLLLSLMFSATNACLAIETYDGGDFYRVGDRRIEMLRSLEEFIVCFKKGISPQKGDQWVRRSLLHNMGVKKSREVAERIFIYTLEKDLFPEPVSLHQTQFVKFLSRLEKARPIEFISYVYIDKETSSKRIVTNEFIVKLRNGATREQLMDFNKKNRVKVVQLLPQTQGQYLLSLSTPKKLGTLRVANQYAENKWIEWSQPNFLSELQLN